MGTKGTVASAGAGGAAAGGHRRHHPRQPDAAARRGAHAGGGGGARDPAGAGLRSFNPSVTACPGCGRTTSTTFQELAKQIDDFLRAQMPVWKTRYPGVENLKVAVMGCIVNGPGESKHADIGISLPGTGEAPAAPVFIDGEKALTLRGEGIARSSTRSSRTTSSAASAPPRRRPDRVPGPRRGAPVPHCPWLKTPSRQRHERHPAARCRRAGSGSRDVVRVRGDARYGYRNMRTPIVEPTALFVRGLGEVTDIVEKEMYSFEDSMNGDRADAAPRGHRRHGARHHRAQPALRRPQAPVLHGPDVPPRAAAARAATGSSTRSASRRWALPAPTSTPS
jgi:hypothetical protein